MRRRLGAHRLGVDRRVAGRLRRQQQARHVSNAGVTERLAAQRISSTAWGAAQSTQQLGETRRRLGRVRIARVARRVAGRRRQHEASQGAVGCGGVLCQRRRREGRARGTQRSQRIRHSLRRVVAGQRERAERQRKRARRKRRRRNQRARQRGCQRLARHSCRACLCAARWRVDKREVGGELVVKLLRGGRKRLCAPRRPVSSA